MIFKNEALIKILGKQEKDKLQTFIDKPVFVNTEINTPMSLINAAMGRYSDFILSQVHSLDAVKTEKEDLSRSKRKGKKKVEPQKKLITFRKNEIYF